LHTDLERGTFPMLHQQDYFLRSVTSRLAALIEDRERLLEVIRIKQTELVRIHGGHAGAPETRQPAGTFNSVCEQ